MKLPTRYPLIQDLGYPDGVPEARRRWVADAKMRRRWQHLGPIIAALVVTMTFSMFGVLPWALRRVASPQQLANQLNAPMPMGNAHLGAEYYNIASAMVDGRGFADPFVIETGPTAWMPPLLVWLQAALISVLGGDRFLVMLAVVLLKTIVLASCAVLIVRQGNRSLTGWAAFGVICLYFVSEHHDCFAFTHDSWLILGSVTGTLCGLVWVDGNLRRGTWTLGKTIAWGCFGGIVALSSPVAGFAWAVGTTCCMSVRAPKAWIAAGIISMAVITPWGIRNKVVLGKFVPIKSNVFFEFDQSMAVDNDGLLDWSTFATHPYHENAERKKYAQMGEIAYLETKKERFFDQVAANPRKYANRVSLRLFATTVLPIGFSGYKQGSCSLPLRWLIYPLPLIAIIVLVGFCRPLTPIQKWAIVLYAAYLFPYVLCSYYPRYGFPLIAIKMLLCFWVIEAIVLRSRKSQSGVV